MNEPSTGDLMKIRRGMRREEALLEDAAAVVTGMERTRRIGDVLVFSGNMAIIAAAGIAAVNAAFGRSEGAQSAVITLLVLGFLIGTTGCIPAFRARRRIEDRIVVWAREADIIAAAAADVRRTAPEEKDLAVKLETWDRNWSAKI